MSREDYNNNKWAIEDVIIYNMAVRINVSSFDMSDIFVIVWSQYIYTTLGCLPLRTYCLWTFSDFRIVHEAIDYKIQKNLKKGLLEESETIC